MSVLDELRNKPINERTPLEQCVVSMWAGEYSTETEIAEQAAKDLRFMQENERSLITVNDELHAKLNVISEAVSQHRGRAFITCDETCFCWTVVTMV